MGLDLSLSGFISAGGGVAYLLAALLWGVSRGARTERLLFTGLLVVWGCFIVNQSLTTPEAPRELTAADYVGIAVIFTLASLTMLFAGAVYTTRIALEEAGTGTRLSMEFAAAPQTFAAKAMGTLFGALMKGSMRKAIQKDLDDIKAVAESRA